MKTKLKERKVRLFGKSIPLIAVVAVVFMVGIASAAVIASLTTPDVTVREPTEASMTGDDYTVEPADGCWDPGDNGTVELVINNTADRGYGLTVTPTATYTEVGTVTVSVGAPALEITDDGTADDANYNIAAASDDSAGTKAEGTLTYTVELESGADSGGVLTVSFEVERVAPWAE